VNMEKQTKLFCIEVQLMLLLELSLANMHFPVLFNMLLLVSIWLHILFSHRSVIALINSSEVFFLPSVQCSDTEQRTERDSGRS